MRINLNNKILIYAMSLISGVLPVAYLLTNTDLKDQKPNKVFIIRLLGYLFSFATYLLLIVLVEAILIEIDMFSNRVQGYIFAVLIFLIVQALMTIAFLSFCSKLSVNVFNFSTNTSNRKQLFYYIFYLSLGVSATIYLFVYGPFLFVIISIYLIPNIYLYSRFKSLFKSDRSIQIFTFTFIIIVSMFAFSDAAIGHIDSIISRGIIYIGYYYAPFLLYTFLLYLAWDILNFMKSKMSRKNSIWENSYRNHRIVFSIIVMTACIIEVVGIFNFNNTRIQKFNIQIAKNASELNGLKIAMAADCHFSEITNDYFVRQFVDKLNTIDADVVLLIGDIFESRKSNSKMDQIQEQLKLIQSKYGVFAVEGNHEYYNETNSIEFFTYSNINLLRDTVILINDAFQIVGRMDRYNYNRLSLDTLLNQMLPDFPTIIMDHQPNTERMANDKIDLYLSGHTHNGQLFPFNLITNLIYDVSWGYKAKGNIHCFVTCGAQGWGPQVKTGSYSEIMEINVDFKPTP